MKALDTGTAEPSNRYELPTVWRADPLLIKHRMDSALTLVALSQIDNLATPCDEQFGRFSYARVQLSHSFVGIATSEGVLPPTPTMAAGITDHIWSLEESAGLLD